MTRSSFLVLALSLVGCGGSREATTACAALITCCASGLPTGVGNTCGELAKSTDESACSSALSEIQAASYCKGVSTSDGPSESSHPCNQYLSCLLATEPAEYAAALQLYGSGSACWANSAQTAGCNEACTSSFADIATACTCTGDSCTSCAAPAVGELTPVGQASNTCEVNVEGLYVTLVSVAADRTASIRVDDGEADVVLFTGTLSCTGTSTFTQVGDGYPCIDDAQLTLVSAGAPGTYLATVSGSVSPQCAANSQASTCTISGTVKSN